MEKLYYSLQLNSEESKYDALTSLLGVKPKDKRGWIYEVVVEQKDEPFDFINSFLNVLEGKYEQLDELGVSRENITIWMIYEYNGQCNMEFEPQDLERLGKNGISLCISCYEGGEE